MRATDWSRNEKTLLTYGGNPYQINLLDLASHQPTVLQKQLELIICCTGVSRPTIAG